MNATQAYTEPVGKMWQYDPQYHRVTEFLGVNKYDRDSDDIHKKIVIIHAWAGNADISKSLAKIDALRKKLGFQFVGKPLVNELYQRIRLQQDLSKTAKQDKPISKNLPPQKPVKEPIQVAKDKESSPIQEMIDKNIKSSITKMTKQTLSDSEKLNDLIKSSVQKGLT